MVGKGQGRVQKERGEEGYGERRGGGKGRRGEEGKEGEKGGRKGKGKKVPPIFQTKFTPITVLANTI